MRRPLIAAAALALVGAGVLYVVGGPSGEPHAVMTEDAFCDALRDLDIGEALGGQDAARKITAVAALAGVGSRAPAEVRDAVETVERQAHEEPNLLAIAGSDLADPDVVGAAFQATYRLGFQPEYRVAAARIERHAVDVCGMEPSGRFDLVLDVEFDDGMFPGLDLSDYEEPVVEFDESTFEPYRYAPIENPTFEFDRSGWDRYRLDGGG